MRRQQFGVQHERRRRRVGHDDCFTVRANIGQLEGANRSPVELIDSQQLDPAGLDPDGFADDVRIAHGVKRRDGRAAKGRLFCVTAGGQVVAFVTFHLPPSPGPLIIEELVIDRRFAAESRAIAKIRRVLLCAVLEASETAGRSDEVLAWATDDEQKAERVEAELGFARAQRPRRTDCRLTHYLERRFSSNG